MVRLNSSNFQTWPNSVQIILTVVMFAAALAGITALVRWWLEKRRVARETERRAYATLILTKKFIGWATELHEQLEEMWHDWNSADLKLIYPLTQNPNVIPQHRVELYHQVHQFRFRLFYYVRLFNSAFPDTLNSLADCSPSLTVEYVRLKRMIEQHIEELKLLHQACEADVR